MSYNTFGDGEGGVTPVDNDSLRADERRPSGYRRTVEERISSILGGPPTLTIGELAEKAGTTVAFARSFWRAMGFANVGDNERIFGEADVVALRREEDEVALGRLTTRTSISLLRAMSHMTDRMVLWQHEAMVEGLMREFDLDDTTARLMVIDRVASYVDHLEKQLTYTWRRQLAALLERSDSEISQMRPEAAIRERMPLQRAVGFVDMVAYTRRSRDLSSHELIDLIQAFEFTTRDIITSNGARVVKTIGDAVMFIADDLPTGATVVCEMAESLNRDPEMLPVRASLVWGGVVSRSGDVYGAVVNLASRLVDIAPVGSVLADEATAAALAAIPAGEQYTMRALAPTTLQGFGEISPVEIARRPEATR